MFSVILELFLFNELTACLQASRAPSKSDGLLKSLLDYDQSGLIGAAQGLGDVGGAFLSRFSKCNNQ